MKMKNRSGYWFWMGELLVCTCILSACGRNAIGDKQLREIPPGDRGNIALEGELAVKGYNLPIDESEKKEAEQDCTKMMGLIRSIYEQADKGNDSNVVLSEETIRAMQDKLKKTKRPVAASEAYHGMKNYKCTERFLKKCIKGISGSVILYEVHPEGGLGRMKFIFDGKQMYVLSMAAVWNTENEPEPAHISYTRIKEWNYTDKGWFCYKLCVPELPEVTEIVNGSCMLRVKPMAAKNRKLSEKCVSGVAYQGNNLLCSDWDSEHMEGLDYNGLYEYFYAMKYQKKFQPEKYPDGIPKGKFEKLIMEYLPVTRKEIQKYAVFNKKKQTYPWQRLGCFNYAPAFFDTAMPEVTHIKKNGDGTVTLTVDAVCQMILCDDTAVTHELTVRFSQDGSFQYLGNKILENRGNIPDYQYRVK